MNFIEQIFSNIQSGGDKPALIEVHGTELKPTSWRELGSLVSRARTFLSRADVKPGDRVVLLASNSTQWAAYDLAILSMGAICVPLYSRQDPTELAFMANDCQPKVVVCSDERTASDLRNSWRTACKIFTFREIADATPAPLPLQVDSIQPSDVITIVYTSGTSGDPKGAMITRANADYMLTQTISRLREATGGDRTDSKVFHFLPVCFMGSRIMLWTQLFRGNPLTLSTDLQNLQQEIATSDPNYYLNVPAVLERIRNGVGQKIKQGSGLGLALYTKGQEAYKKVTAGNATILDRFFLTLARKLVFSKIKQKVGPSLEFLICGSAALSEETQRWFEMVGIRVLQVYGLTETTAIITMDKPNSVKPGWVGHAIDGCEVKLTEEGELICRGPNIFVGYWNKPDATRKTLQGGWLYTGDQAEIHPDGNLRIIGRVKNILVPQSGHNVFPEPIEEQIKEACPGAEHVVLIGHGRPFLIAIVTGDTTDTAINTAIEKINGALPHYRKVRKFYYSKDKLTIESGMLTANQKLRRKVIEQHFQSAIDELYRQEVAA